MHRFFVPGESISGSKVVFPEEIGFQIRKVLRLSDGDTVAVLDNGGLTRLVELSIAGNGIVEGSILETFQEKRGLPVQLDLYVSLTSREKFEWILQKSTEAGVSRIIPFFSERSLVQGNEKAPDLKKQQRRNAIIREAAEQCERSKLPVLENAVSFREAIQSVSSEGTNLLFWEEETSRTIWQALNTQLPNQIALMTGPEGGFSEAEAAFAQSNGWQLVTLGSRILRMETAAIAAILQTAYEIDRRKSLP